MTSLANSEIAAAWLENCRDAISHGSESKEASATFWAYIELDALCTSDPMRALEIIVEILCKWPEERVRYNLAAGPLEVLITRSGPTVLSEIQVLARQQSGFLELLGGVWTDDMPRPMREAIANLITGGSGPPH